MNTIPRLITLLLTASVLTWTSTVQAKEWEKWERDQFNNSDSNKDGFVDFGELVGYHTHEQARKATFDDPKQTATWWMELKDLNKDGKLTIEEFHYWKKKDSPAAGSSGNAAPKKKEWAEWERDQFNGSDSNKDGFVDFEELVGFHVREKARKGSFDDPRQTATWWMELKDHNKDKKLTIEEFYYWKKK